MSTPSTLAVMGLWHQGLVGAACLAEAGNRVIALSTSQKEASGLAKLKLPVEEPGLRDLLSAQIKKGALSFSTDVKSGIAAADFVFLMHDLPVNEKDESSDAIVFADLKALIPHLSRRAILVVTAQCRVGTCRKIQAALKAAKKDNAVCYIPENLRLGQAIPRFKNPDLPVIGASSDVAFQKLQALLSPFAQEWRATDLNTAEMLKHALNAYLATTIAFANEIGMICEQVGANGHAVGDFLKLEPRVGKKAMLRPGLGYAGGTLGRDIQALGKIAREGKLRIPLIQGVADSNRLQHQRIFQKIIALCAEYQNPTVCVLGLAYKPDTSATRRSSAVEVIRLLQKQGYRVRAYDPGIQRKDPNLAGIDVLASMDAALKDAHVAVLMTPWDCFVQARPADFKKRMRGTTVFDPNNCWKKEEFTRGQLRYVNFGAA